MIERRASDLLWRRLDPLLPPHGVSSKGGRPWADDRACLEGILFVLDTGLPWDRAPKELGPSGVTCWRRLREWQAAGAWEALRRTLLGSLGRSGGLDWSRASLDSTSVPAKRGAPRSGRTRRTEGVPARSTT